MEQTKKMQTYFKRRRLITMAVLGVFVLLYGASTLFTGFSGVGTFLMVPKGLRWLGQNFWPTTRSLGYGGFIFTRLMQTVGLAIASTTVATFFAIFVAIFGSSVTGLNKGCMLLARLIASVFRNIPIVAWAMILLFSFKQNDLTGFLALFLITFGTLIRAFMETIEDEAGQTIQALRATGASYLQVIFQGVLPTVAATLISWILYMVENNVRDATLVGILTGSGIGFLFDLYYKSFRYDLAGMVTLQIVIVVVVIELLSNQVRRLTI